jgi:hypothetical protein
MNIDSQIRRRGLRRSATVIAMITAVTFGLSGQSLHSAALSLSTVPIAARAAVAPALAATVPAATPQVVAVPSSGLLFGASAYDTSGLNLPTLESQVGRTMAIERGYSQWNDPQPSTKVINDVSAGRTALISIRPQLQDGTKISWAAVASGADDAAIQAQARGLASVNAPVMLSFHHEADLSSGYGTADEFRAAFRHYVAVVRSTGEQNISFVLILSAADYGSQIANWYPGDDVVDWAGADAYNFGACKSGVGPWRSFAAAVAPFEAWGAKHDKPQVLAEWASAENPSDPGAKAQWITDAATVMKSWRQLHATSYFDQVGSCDWRLTSSTSAMAAFTALATSTYANATASARLVPSVSGRKVSWQASASTGSHYITGHGVTSWSFSAGDGTAVTTGTGRSTSISHTYKSAGTYLATLTVRDNAGDSSTTHVSVNLT